MVVLIAASVTTAVDVAVRNFCWEIGLNIFPTTQDNEQIYIEKNKQQRTIIKKTRTYVETPKPEKNYGPPERKFTM